MALGSGQQTLAGGPSQACQPVFVQPVSYEWLLHFLMVWEKSKEEEYFEMCKNYMKFKFQHPSVKFYWHKPCPSMYVCIVCAELLLHKGQS